MYWNWIQMMSNCNPFRGHDEQMTLFAGCIIITNFVKSLQNTLRVEPDWEIYTKMWHSSTDVFVCVKMFYFKSLLYGSFCCVHVVNCGFRTGVGRLRSCCLALLFLWQFFCWRWSQDAHGCLAVTYDFWFGNKSHHHSHLLHHLLQSRVLWKKKKKDKCGYAFGKCSRNTCPVCDNYPSPS